MPGGKNNIKPEDGKQFSSTYQPSEKWTEKKAVKIGNDLIKWLKADDENIFFNEFLIIKNDYYEELISYLSKKFTSFLKLIENAKKIQELKLVKFGVFDKLNATMTKFTLINNHNWKDKQEIEQTAKNDFKIIVSSEEEKQDIENLDKILNEDD